MAAFTCSIMQRRVMMTLAFVVFVAVASSAYTLFSGGKTDYTIYVSPNASKSETHSAAELSSYLSRISGASFKVVNNISDKGRHIFVGYNDRTAKVLKASVPDEKSDRFTYVSHGGDIYIYGSRKRGTMYGVYSFLEDMFGVRWFTPEVTKIPRLSKFNFKSVSKTDTPAIAVRNVYYHNCFDAAWCAHNKVNGTSEATMGKEEWGGTEGYWGCHTSGLFVPASKYFNSHPEYFALRGTKRVPDGQLCLTNPDVLKICISEIKKAMDLNPGYIIFDMSQNDNFSFCQCSKCSAIAEKYGSQSGVWLWFVNQVAAAVKKSHPDKYVGTFAYQYTRKPPVGIVPADNVVIRLCSIECCFAHSLEECTGDENKKFISDMKQWSRIAPHLFIWDYVVTFSQYLGPFPNFAVLGPNARTYADNNAMGVFEEGQYQTNYGEFSELRAYLLSRLLWNPEADVNAMAKEFINGFYGDGAPQAWSYYEMVCNLVKPSVHVNIFSPASHPVFNDDFINKSLALLSQGMKRCEGKAEYRHMEHLWLSPAYMHVKRNKDAAIADGTYSRFVSICRRDSIMINEGHDLDKFLSELK